MTHKLHVEKGAEKVIESRKLHKHIQFDRDELPLPVTIRPESWQN